LSDFAQTPVNPCAYNISTLNPEGRPNIGEMAMRVIWSGVLIAASTAIGMTDVCAQGTEFGKNEYVKSCASCHGVTGKGDGPMAKAFKKPLPDLTKLSETNKGVFPTSRIYDAIDGRIEVMSHGRRDMPVWGDIYTSELTARLPRDSLSKETVDALVRVRILTLVEYISTLQGK
jgi:mono/diheme cytochrome c family protein